MYFFVMYNLSGRQQGIQAGHAAVEYSRLAGSQYGYADYCEFADKHKTFILLDGGGSIDMEHRMSELNDLRISYAPFREPDLNGSVSAIAFIIHEDIYSIDLTDPLVSGSEVPSYEYRVKSYLSKFRLASN